MFKVYDKVYSVSMGWGVVVDVLNSSDYPVKVLFCDDDETEVYSQEGRYFIDENRSLFFAEIPIPPEALGRPANYKKGELIMVVSKCVINAPEFWCVRRFARLREDGAVVYKSVDVPGFTHVADKHMSLSEFDEKFNQ